MRKIVTLWYVVDVVRCWRTRLSATHACAFLAFSRALMPLFDRAALCQNVVINQNCFIARVNCKDEYPLEDAWTHLHFIYGLYNLF